jgi:hypothetical protein
LQFADERRLVYALGQLGTEALGHVADRHASKPFVF